MKKSELKELIKECIQELDEGNEFPKKSYVVSDIKKFDKEVQKVAKLIDGEFRKSEEMIWNGAYYDDYTIYLTFGMDPYEDAVKDAQKIVKKLKSKIKNFTFKLVKYEPSNVGPENKIIMGWG